MEATDTTIWTLVTFWNKNLWGALLPRRYCTFCFRDKAEAAQSRRDVFKNIVSSSSDSDASCELDPNDEDFCKGPGTRFFFGPTDMRAMLWKQNL